MTKISHLLSCSVLTVFSSCLQAWKCPHCAQSFKGLSSVAHNCRPISSISPVLNNWLDLSGFALRPSSRSNAIKALSKYLNFLPLYSNDPGLPDGITQWLYHWLEHLGLCEHGGCIVGAWQSPKGEEVKMLVDQVSQDLRFASTIGYLQLRQISSEFSQGMNDFFLWNYPDPSSGGNTDNPIMSFSDWYYNDAGMCSCGNPDEVFCFFHDALSFFSQPVRSPSNFPISDECLKSCFISWMIHKGLITAGFKLTKKGQSVLYKLKLGYPDYIDDPCED